MSLGLLNLNANTATGINIINYQTIFGQGMKLF